MDGGKVSTGRIRNISLGGVFIEMDVLKFGTEVALTFSVPSAPTIRCRAYVVWNSDDPSREDIGMKGNGLRLTDISVSDMRALSEYIEGKLQG